MAKSRISGVLRWTTIVCAALLLGACGHATAGKSVGVLKTPEVVKAETRHPAKADVEIEDLIRIPQQLDGLAAAAGSKLALDDACRDRLLGEFRQRYFAPWSASAPAYDPAESADFMKQEGRATWYGPNKRKVPQKQMQELLANCALESFPSRSDAAISVAPGHLRGLPTHLPLFQSPDDFPFDRLSYPQVKLNEPLRVLHASRDGVWLFVETGYTNGWLERRDVALVEPSYVEARMQAPHVAVLRDYAPVPDGRGIAVSRAKVGTILPLTQGSGDGWQVAIASAGEGGRAVIRSVPIPRDSAAPFPLAFEPENIARIGNQFLGAPYGWGEIYGLRDCSAMLRDFFLPFGIWLPRTSLDQIASLSPRVKLAGMAPPRKEKEILGKGVPFLTLLYKPGHIMLYVGVDGAGRPLVFHDAWSIRLKAELQGGGSAGIGSAGSSGTVAEKPGSQEGRPEHSGGVSGEWTRIIGESAITSLEPGRELGLVPGGSLLERITELGTITNRCAAPPVK